MNVKEAQAAINALNELSDVGDQEINHKDADEILLRFIRDVQYPDVAKAYEDARKRVRFWYA